MDQINNLEKLFTVDTAKLKQITDHFVNELEKGTNFMHFLKIKLTL